MELGWSPDRIHVGMRDKGFVVILGFYAPKKSPMGTTLASIEIGAATRNLTLDVCSVTAWLLISLA